MILPQSRLLYRRLRRFHLPLKLDLEMLLYVFRHPPSEAKRMKSDVTENEKPRRKPDKSEKVPITEQSAATAPLWDRF
jgi:hypothetical protein